MPRPKIVLTLTPSHDPIFFSNFSPKICINNLILIELQLLKKNTSLFFDNCLKLFNYYQSLQ